MMSVGDSSLKNGWPIYLKSFLKLLFKKTFDNFGMVSSFRNLATCAMLCRKDGGCFAFVYDDGAGAAGSECRMGYAVALLQEPAPPAAATVRAHLLRTPAYILRAVKINTGWNAGEDLDAGYHLDVRICGVEPGAGGQDRCCDVPRKDNAGGTAFTTGKVDALGRDAAGMGDACTDLLVSQPAAVSVTVSHGPDDLQGWTGGWLEVDVGTPDFVQVAKVRCLKDGGVIDLSGDSADLECEVVAMPA